LRQITKQERIALRITGRQRARLEAAAAVAGVNLSEIVRRLIGDDPPEEAGERENGRRRNDDHSADPDHRVLEMESPQW